MPSRHWTARQRLGRLLMHRREELDPRYHIRKVFAEERGIHIRKAADIENSWRDDFPPLTLKDVVAPAYGVTYESILDAIEGGDLVEAPGTPPHRPPAGLRSRLSASPRPLSSRFPDPAARETGDGGWMPDLDAATLARARPIADSILMARGDWRAAWAAAHPGTALTEVPEPPGEELFPDDADDAGIWDRRAAILTVPERARLIAVMRAREASRQESGTG